MQDLCTSPTTTINLHQSPTVQDSSHPPPQTRHPGMKPALAPSSTRRAERPCIPTQLQQTCTCPPVPSFLNKATWQHPAPWPHSIPGTPPKFRDIQMGWQHDPSQLC